MTTGIDSTLLDIPEMTPEKLAVMKLNAADVDRSVFSDAGDLAFEDGRLDFSSSRAEGGRSSLSRSSRHVRSSSRRTTGSFIQTHRDKMALDITAQAESKFFALMEFMSSASREASSLKEYWSKLMSDREGWAKEREELLVRIDEVTETLEQKETQHHNHGREITERRKEVEKLLLELSTALAGIAEQKKIVAERDHELERSRGEIHEIRLSSSRSQIDFDKLKADLESLEARLRHAESERDHARQDEERYRSELRLVTREHTELKSKFNDISFKLETTQKEVTILLERIRAFEREREDHLHEKDRLQEELRKITSRFEETTRELTEITERYDRLQREVARTKETIRFIESERDEHSITIEHLRHELKTKSTHAEDAETRYADVLLKYEQTKRSLASNEQRLRELDVEITSVKQSLEKKTEEHRVIVVERDQFRDDLDDGRRKYSDHDRHIADLEASLRRAESSLIEVRSESSSVTERIRQIELERDDARSKHAPLHNEIIALKEQLVLLHAEIKNITDARDRARQELTDFRRQYEEVTETIEEYNNGDEELKFEIESLRTLLREAREQKETAVAARATADRERDEAYSKYEAKCRELERWEESRSAWIQSHGGSSGRGETRTSSTRIVHRSGTTSSSHQHHSGEAVDGNVE